MARRKNFWAAGLIGFALPLVLLGPAQGSDFFLYSEGEDELSGKKERVMLVASQEKKVLSKRAVVRLSCREGQIPALSLIPSTTIFPDSTDASVKTMEVQATIRSSSMEEPLSKTFSMNWFKYDTCYIGVTRETAKQLFSGAYLVFRFDKTKNTDKIAFLPEDREAIQEAVEKVLEFAEYPQE